ncbi:MAG: thioredoxin family protein, partial [Segetibacter sp.]
RIILQKNLVLVDADFPRYKKNELPKQQVKENEALAEKYNPSGRFPLTVLLNANGQVLKQWDGLPDETAEKFVDEIKTFQHAGN